VVGLDGRVDSHPALGIALGVDPAGAGEDDRRAHPPGAAHLYNEGDLHSPRRDGPTRLIRIEGRNLDHIRRLAYEAV
jgi:hypothetical protein